MRLEKNAIRISATDLAKYLACRHLTSLDLRAAHGEIERPYRHDPAVAVLEERGRRHEAAYLAYLKESGNDLLLDDESLDHESRIRRTIDAMRAGIGVIAQADLRDGRWFGRA